MLVLASFASGDDQCGVYLGPSSTTTENEPKLGLYAGKDYETGDALGRPEVGIPLIDFTESWNRRDTEADLVMQFLEGFLWTAEYGGSKWEGNKSVTNIIPGFGTLAAYHAGTHNVDWRQGSVITRDREGVTVPGKSHPSRGAISTYTNYTMRASQPIKRGMEIFANFGDVWDGDKNKEDIYGDKLTRWDYQDADKILEKILEFMDKHGEKMNAQTRDDVLDFVLGKVLGTAAGTHAKVIRSLIPAHPGKLQTVKDMGGTFAYRNPDLVKTQKWLDKHAVCADNLENKLSTNPEAGRGAFAVRNIKKGKIVAPVPMLHIAKDDVTFMYELVEKVMDNGKKKFEYNLDKPLGQQLLVNYCLAHPESSMFLFPLSSQVTQVNHAPPEKANARLTWSKNKYWGNAYDLQDMTPKELADYHHVSVTMELYALRDIAEGEEVFIDYGREWEAAWKTHMADYKESDWPIKAEDLKQEFKNKPHKTREEREKEPLPENVKTVCIVETDEMTDGMRKVNDEGDEIAIWVAPANLDEFIGSNMYLCDIIDKKPSGEHFYNYTIWGYNDGMTTEVIDVPHSVVSFVDMPYTSDMHHADAFRHPIGIPDVIFPQAWRDRRN